MLPSFLITFVTCLSVFECTRVQILRAKNTGKFSDKFPLTGTLGTLSTRSVSECQATCVSNKECLSFFYNAIENKCTLHGDSFTYSVPAGTGSGWKFYLTFDGMYNFAQRTTTIINYWHIPVFSVNYYNLIIHLFFVIIFFSF